MTDTPTGPTGGQMSDRMQALLSAAAEEQVREQRAVSAVLGELRGQVAALSESVRAAATDATVERLGGVVSTVVADLRTSTSLLGQRIEALSKRIDAVGADTAVPTEQAAVRLAALSADVAAQGELVAQMTAALRQLAGFPAALASLQNDVAGLHDRLQPLTELRAGLSDLGARTAHSLEQLRPQVEGLSAKLDAIGTVPDTERLRDAVVDALGARLDRLAQAAERPVVGPEALKAHFGDMRAALDSQTGDRFDEVQASLGAVENRLGQVGERLADVGDAAGGIPAVSAEIARLHARFDELQTVRELVTTLAADVAALHDDSSDPTLTLGLAALREDVEHLGAHLAEQTSPTAEEIAGLVSQRVADRLVETLAPRIADVVLTRVSAALVTQLGEALSPRVKADTEDVVRTATADSERRVLAHVDEAVLALAEALLRRRRGTRTAEAALEELGGALEEPAAETAVEPPPPEPAPPEPAPQEPVPQESVADVLDRINAAPEPPPADDRPAVTSSLAPPAPTAGPPAAPEKAEPVAERPAEQPAKVAQAPQKAPPKAVAKAPSKTLAKAPVKRVAAPVKKATRPAAKPVVLERTPDLSDDVQPVPSGPPRPAQPPASAPPAPPAPTAPSAAPPPPPAPAPKRKPWWRPGG